MTILTDSPPVYDPSREARVLELMEDSKRIMHWGIQEFIAGPGKSLAGICTLFSGGNDSTVLGHMFREVADYAAHINTGIGIEQTRQFVRETCAEWGLPLIEEHPPPGSTYRELILDQGFPGPAMHWKMYQRLKERGLRKVRNSIVNKPRSERVVFLAGRRRDESKRRINVPESERDGSVVWISPLVRWTKEDLNTYRTMFDVPRNPVADKIHMSGECLCGSFAKPGELDEIEYWFPDVAAEIHALEHEVEAAGIPFPKCMWGWGHNAEKPSRSGPMCSTCDANFGEMN